MAKKAILLSLPIPELYPDKQKVGRSFPLASGCLKSMARHQPDLQQWDIEILPRWQNDIAGDALLVDILSAQKPQVLGLSLYCWNRNRSLYLASELKTRLPDLEVLVGGPEVTPDSSEILANPAVSVGVRGGGETVFADLLRRIQQGAPLRGAPGTLWYERAVCSVPAAEQSPSAVHLPSPLLGKCLDLSSYKYVLLETSRGCPFHCKFCSERNRAQGSPGRFPLERIREELSLIKAHGVKGIYFIDSIFNMASGYEDLCGMLRGLNSEAGMEYFVSFLAEGITAEQVRQLDSSFVVDVGLQSMSGTALGNVSRTLNLSRFMKGMGLLRDAGVRRKAHVILGLPGDTKESLLEMAAFLQEEREAIPGLVVFILQLLRDSGLYREAALHGLQAQKEPPYFVLQSNTIAYRDLREIILMFQEMFTDPRWHRAPPRWSRTSHGRYPGKPAEKHHGELADFPITCILLSLQENREQELIIRNAERISRRLSSTVTLWLEGMDESHLPLVKHFLSVLSCDNPYTVWNLIIETAIALPLSFPAEVLSGIRYLPHYLDYASLFLQDDPSAEYVRTAARAFVLLSGEGEYPAEWVREMNRNHPVYRKVRLEPGASEGTCRRLLNLQGTFEGEGVVLDFSFGCSPAEVVETLTELRRCHLALPIGLTDLVLQQEWDSGGAEYADISGLAAVEDHVVSFEASCLCGELLSRKRVASDYLGWLGSRKQVR